MGFLLCCTVRTDAFQYIVDAVQAETFGQFYHWGGDVGEAESPVALFTMEVGVEIVHFA